MMEGFLSRLETATLGEIMWVVFPMVNVDGVILGNNRTGISGLDYNRFWSFE
jgi:murein tripeptide amidase MpaA